jgi:hypothetical protein
MSINRRVRGIRGSIPPGYIVGRTAGNGPPQLLKINDMQTQIQASASSTPGTTYTAATGLKLTGNSFRVAGGVLVALHDRFGGI